jgi:hypothetical protein
MEEMLCGPALKQIRLRERGQKHPELLKIVGHAVGPSVVSHRMRLYIRKSAGVEQSMQFESQLLLSGQVARRDSVMRL